MARIRTTRTASGHTAPYPAARKVVKRRRPCDHCRERRGRCVPLLRFKMEALDEETVVMGEAGNTSPCENCQDAGLVCTYGEVERNWQGRQRSYGTLSELDQRLALLESKLAAKLDEPEYAGLQDALGQAESSTADAPIGAYANDELATLSAAFEFASSYWPADPGDSTRYSIGFASARVGTRISH